MRKLSTASGRLTIGAGVCALALLTACTTAQRRQTDIMEKTGAVDISAAVLRARVNDLADRLAGRMVETADGIRTRSTDPLVRRYAIALKADGIPSLYAAAYRVDPLTAAVDVWAFTFQTTRFFGDGPAGNFFGAEQEAARAGAASLLAEADDTLRTIVARPEDFERVRARIESWALANPIETSFSSRPAATAFMAEMRSDERDAFAAVGSLTETVETVSERLNTYAIQLPKQARWQGELLIAQLVADHDVDGILADLDGALGEVSSIGDAARRADGFLEDLPSLIGEPGTSLADIVAAERRAVLEGVELERLDTLKYLTAERAAVLVALAQERTAALDALRQERVAAFTEMDAIRRRAWDDAEGGLRELVDYTLGRVAVLLLALMIAAGVLGVIVYWLTLGLRRRAAAI